MILQQERPTAEFFALARERFLISIRRGLRQAPPWTTNPWMKDYHVCNVFRDQDAVSKYIMRMLIPYNEMLGLMIAPKVASISRLINNEESLAKLFPDSKFSNQWPELLREVRLNTHAYKINTPLGLNNRDGIMLMILKILGSSESKWREQASLRWTFIALKEEFDLTPFVAYQVAHDLKGSTLIGQPIDQDTWTYIGPGAVRGALRLHGFDIAKWAQEQGYVKPKDGTRVGTVKESWLKSAVKELTGWDDHIEWTLSVCRLLLIESVRHWPHTWPQWHLSEAENWLCEYDKLCRWAEIGPQGARRFRGGQ